MSQNRTHHRMALIALAAGLMLPLSFARADDQPNRGAGNQGINSNNNPGTNTDRGTTADRGTAADRNASPDKGDRAGANYAKDPREFVTKAACGNLAEVKLGELALQRAQSAEVKQFAQKMIDDHSKANEQLKQLAQKKGIEWPTELKGEEKEHFDKIQQAKGADFDREYIRLMVEDHQKDVEEFRHESQNSADADVKAWAAQTLPTLEQHFKQVQQVAQAIGVEGARTAGEKQPPESNQPRTGTGDQNRIGSQPGNTGNQPGNQPQQPDTSRRPGENPSK